MRRFVLYIGGLLALFAIPGLAAPATACGYSRPVFAAEPGRPPGVKIRVEQALLIGEGGALVAVRGTVLDDSAIARRGGSIVIVVPSYQPDSCYYYDFYDQAAITSDGLLEAYVDLMATREPSGAFSARAAHRSERYRYNLFAEGRLRGRWVRASFGSGDD